VLTVRCARCGSGLYVAFCSFITRPPISTLFPYTTLFRSQNGVAPWRGNRDIFGRGGGLSSRAGDGASEGPQSPRPRSGGLPRRGDRKSTRLNSSHVKISYAVFCLKKKKISQRAYFANYPI